MATLDVDTQLLLARFADGELTGAESARAEREVESNPAAAAYVAELASLKAVIALPIDRAAEQVDFGGLFARVEARLDAPERSRAMDRLVIAFADGAIADAAERGRVGAYIDAHPEVREGFEAVRALGAIVRAPIDGAAGAVDFSALARRIDAAIDAERGAGLRVAMARPVVRAPWWSRVLDAIGGPRAILASAATACAVFVIMRPGATPAPADPIQVHNNYFYQGAPAETFGYGFDSLQKGVVGTFQPEDKVTDMAPVIWIASDGSGGAAQASPPQKAPATDLGAAGPALGPPPVER